MNTFRSFDISGCLMPVRANGQPVLMQIPDQVRPSVVVFTHSQDLREAMEAIGVLDFSIKEVVDGREFVASIVAQGVKVALNPRQVDGNRVRWVDIIAE